MAAKKVFDDLVKEPTRIPADVAKLEAEVQKIVTAMASDSRAVNFKQLYVQALVASSHRDALWRGFVDGNAYVDCLCRALLCQLKGHDAAAHLERRKAVLKCKAEAEETRCTWLRDHTDAAVMAEYERLVAEYQQSYGDQQSGDYGDQKPGRRRLPTPEARWRLPTPATRRRTTHPRNPAATTHPRNPAATTHPRNPAATTHPRNPAATTHPRSRGGDEGYGSEGYRSSEEGPGGYRRPAGRRLPTPEGRRIRQGSTAGPGRRTGIPRS